METSLGVFLFAHISQFLIATNQIKISAYLHPVFIILFLFLAVVQTVKFILKNNLSLTVKTRI
jgi:hypothetical protein